MKVDERTQQVAGQSAMIMLGLTQTALGAVILVRLYLNHQPDAELRDFQIVLLGSIVGYFILRSFLGGIMPVPTLRQAIIAYVLMVVGLFTVLSLWLGLPDLSEWTTNVLPVTLGPAVVAGGYWIIAALGKWRIERQFE